MPTSHPVKTEGYRKVHPSTSQMLRAHGRKTAQALGIALGLLVTGSAVIAGSMSNRSMSGRVCSGAGFNQSVQRRPRSLRPCGGTKRISDGDGNARPTPRLEFQ